MNLNPKPNFNAYLTLILCLTSIPNPNPMLNLIS